MLESIFIYIHQIFANTVLKSFLSIIFLSLEYMIGGFDLIVYALLWLLILDFIAGFSVASRDGKLSRKKMMDGLFKMIVYFIGVAMAHWTDIIIFHTTLEFGFKNFIVVYLGVNESLSIIKHMSDLGVNIPIKLIKRLENYRDNLDLK